jgi:hypothetical protein
MTQEQQKAAVERILAREPLTEEERELYEFRTKTVEEYEVPTDRRVCGLCGARFKDVVDGKGVVQVSMLEQFSDHQAEHNPTPAQWAEAHHRIQMAKESKPAT